MEIGSDTKWYSMDMEEKAPRIAETHEIQFLSFYMHGERKLKGGRASLAASIEISHVRSCPPNLFRPVIAPFLLLGAHPLLLLFPTRYRPCNDIPNIELRHMVGILTSTLV
ncbi:hypothetical protein AC579_1518 [Pseudocercospora musae]|uniref:Uncharacterized protein n=1 Tax=Pseudocercospora musae TaxID=113226 RepID=A0A139ILT8_9PEZI|nr:hypothetical protein AC579_1518 [Pseudocercospora musae]